MPLERSCEGAAGGDGSRTELSLRRRKGRNSPSGPMGDGELGRRRLMRASGRGCHGLRAARTLSPASPHLDLPAPPAEPTTRCCRGRSLRRSLPGNVWTTRTGPPRPTCGGSDPDTREYLPRPLPPDADRELQRRLSDDSSAVATGLLVMRRTGLRVGELRRLERDCLREDQERSENWLRRPRRRPGRVRHRSQASPTSASAKKAT
jgi:hypothetical protein